MQGDIPRKYLIITAGGSGERFQADIPKQFIPLSGRPVLMRTIEAFTSVYSEIEIILVLPENHIELWKSMCDEFRFNARYRIVTGGETRFHSVRNGLNSLKEADGIVGIHDGVRPFPTKELIQRCFSIAEEHGSAIPVIPLSDSLRKLRGSNRGIPVERDDYVAVQTPQCFQLELIRKAYEHAEDPGTYTDDATVLEAYGHPVNLIDGIEENIKITRPVDLHFGEALLNRFKIR